MIQYSKKCWLWIYDEDFIAQKYLRLDIAISTIIYSFSMEVAKSSIRGVHLS